MASVALGNFAILLSKIRILPPLLETESDKKKIRKLSEGRGYDSVSLSVVPYSRTNDEIVA